MIDRVIKIIDTHTAGEPTRITVGGLPRIRGNSILEKHDFSEHGRLSKGIPVYVRAWCHWTYFRGC